MSQREFQMYCASIRDTAAWGGEPEIMALSRSYNVPIHVVQAGKPPVVIHEPPPNTGNGTDGKIVFISYHRRMYGLGEVSSHPGMHFCSTILTPCAIRSITTRYDRNPNCPTCYVLHFDKRDACYLYNRDIRLLVPPHAPAGIPKAASLQTRFAGCPLGSAAAGPRRTRTHCQAWRKDHIPWVPRSPRFPPALILKFPSLGVVVPGPCGRLAAGQEVQAPVLMAPIQEPPYLIAQRSINPSPQAAALFRLEVVVSALRWISASQGPIQATELKEC